MKYFSFTQTGDFSGIYQAVVSTTSGSISGDLSQPSDILKLEGTDFISFNNILVESDFIWTTELKDKWLNSYLRHVNLLDYINQNQYNEIMNNASDLFVELKNPSIAYITINDGSGTNAPYDDNFITNEVSIGMNVYRNEFIRDISSTTGLNSIIYHHKQEPVYISNVSKVTYNGFSDIVWCFDGYYFENYDISLIGTPSLINGGGNRFGEVKLAGNGIHAHYKVRKNVSGNDPTFGMCSGDDKPFCMGDRIVLVDTTCWTESGTSGWTWIGDTSVLNYEWNLADVSNPCIDYQYVPIYDMIFPIRVIQFCTFENYG